MQACRQTPGRRGLPLEELMHPAVIVAIVTLGINDWLLKGRCPGLVTGKLSDFAGILFFPLLLTALADTLALAFNLAAGMLGSRKYLNHSLTTAKLLTATGLTGIFFTMIKLSAGCRNVFIACMAAVGIPSAISPDATDLIALVMLVPAFLIGTAAMRRVEFLREEAVT